MRIEHGMLVKLRYVQTLIHRDGSTRQEEPREVAFVFGIERQLPSLEHALRGRVEGERLEISLPPEDLFGHHDPSLVREIPKAGLKKQRLRQGRPYREIKRGSLVSFVAAEIREDTVLADFNHPYAGSTGRAKVTILEVRPPGEEELQEALDRLEC